MKKIILIFFVFNIGYALPQSIEETLEQINSLKKEISQNENDIFITY